MPKSVNKIQLIINGTEIPCPSGYSYVDAKSFFKEPTRSALGVINNLNSYATFFTPRLRFNFKFMPIESYRIIMKLIKSFNEFIVTAYDPVEDIYVTRKMYFYPKEFPEIYQKSLETLAILNETFELVGTNADLEKIKITYDKNDGSGEQSVFNTYYGTEFIVGSYDEGQNNPTEFINQYAVLESWNTESDGSGVKYLTNSEIMITTDMMLYAQWVYNQQYILGFNYNGATGNNSEIYRKITYADAFGTLPSPTRNGYNFMGWFIDDRTQVTSASIYGYDKDINIYAKWEAVTND